MAPGRVVYAGNYGNTIIIEHDNDSSKYYTLYGHLKCNGFKLNVDDYVNANQLIGYTSGTDDRAGLFTGAHLHFEIRDGINNIQHIVNPCIYLEDCNCSTTCKNYSQKDDPNKCPQTT